MKLKVDKMVLELMLNTFSYCMGEEECQMVSCTENEITLKMADNTIVTLYTEEAA